MSHVIAILDQSTCQLFRSIEDVPENAIVFTCPEDMAAGMHKQTMDSIRSRILGVRVEMSPTQELAATRLWHVMSVGAESVHLRLDAGTREIKRDLLGNPKIRTNGKIEVMQLLYSPGEDPLMDAFHRRLSTQAKQIVQFLIDDGRMVWTGEDFYAVIMSRIHEVKSRQPATKLAAFHIADLQTRHFLRRLTFAEFATNKAFSKYRQPN